METLYQILGIAGAVFLVWLLYRTVKGRPEQFSREKMSKSATTMGILALGLMAFIALLILYIRST